jgi:hypothetical protein
MAVCRFWAARGRRKPEVTSPLLVFNTHYLSSMHCLIVKPSFWIVDDSGMSISTARGV